MGLRGLADPSENAILSSLSISTGLFLPNLPIHISEKFSHWSTCFLAFFTCLLACFLSFHSWVHAQDFVIRLQNEPTARKIKYGLLRNIRFCKTSQIDIFHFNLNYDIAVHRYRDMGFPSEHPPLSHQDLKRDHIVNYGPIIQRQLQNL